MELQDTKTDRKDLKIQHYRQRVAEYEDKFADLRIQLTEYETTIKFLQNRVSELESQFVSEEVESVDLSVESDSTGDLSQD